MVLAILCSGQGVQNKNMFALSAKAPSAQPIFAKAAEFLGGRDPRDLIAAPAQDSHENHVAQLLCVTQALSAAAALGDDFWNSGAFVLVGYSVGEMAVWGLSGAFSAETILELTDQRARAMDAASQPGDGLIFVRGPSASALKDLCATAGAFIAIINPGDGYVLGGRAAAIEVLMELLTKTAAHVVRLDVRVASHTPLLLGAAQSFQRLLRQVEPCQNLKPNRRLLSGVDGEAVFNLEDGLTKLSAQIAQTVNWSACLASCVEAGASGFLELGPGGALSAMAQTAYPSVNARSFEEFHTVDGARAWARRFSERG